MKLITRDTDYAIRALIFLAKQKEGLVITSKLVKELRVPRPFLRKILQVLNKEGLLRSYKGKGGGFKLAIEPNKIYLLDLMKIFQGEFSFNECFLKKMACPNKKNCLLKKKIDTIEDYVFARLKDITLKSLLG